MSLFADDLATWADCPSRRKGAQKCWRERFQNCMNEVENYMEVDGFQLSAEKTVLLVFTRQALSRKDYSIRINNTVILPSTEVKFLGVTILCRTSAGHHTSEA